MTVETIVQQIESARPGISAKLEAARRSALGQFMTPASVAQYMASLFAISSDSKICLLDPGAGLGALSAAFIHRWQSHAKSQGVLDVVVYEIDSLSSHRPLEKCQRHLIS
jgi:adenine-specific DNA-methyltransferase